jgi:hypothetical protein
MKGLFQLVLFESAVCLHVDHKKSDLLIRIGPSSIRSKSIDLCELSVVHARRFTLLVQFWTYVEPYVNFVLLTVR